MRLLFKSPAIAAVVLAGTSDGWPKAEVERGSGKTPARLGRAILQGARRARKEDEMVVLAVDAFPLEADRHPRALQAATAPTCKVNGVETAFVDCTGDGADCQQKCLDACNGDEGCSCCVGRDACKRFQGMVCPDGSCSGVQACESATIGYVVDGCQELGACFYAGHNNGDLGSVVSSCNGNIACDSAARNGGEIQEITSSCNDSRACQYVAYGGYIKGRLSESCNADRACHAVAQNGGEIQEITSSCNSNRGCISAAYNGGYIKGISLSCNADYACSRAALGGTIPNKMERCCNSASACGSLAEDGQQDPDPDQCEAPPSRSPTKAPSKAPTPNPTEAPTMAPAEAPTKVPTSAPTKAPAEVPTMSPQPPSLPTNNAAPWDIKFISVEPDFSTSSTDELVLTFEVGRGRKVEHGVYHKDCSTAIAGTTVTVAETREDKDLEYDTLVLAVDVDKNAIALSNIWNEEASMVEVCTVVHLISEDDELGEMIVAEMKRVTEIDYDLDALYNATLALSEGVVEKDTESFDATSVLSICKCTSLENFTCSDDPLSPDQNDLFLCYTSVDESIEVQTVLSLTIAQEGRQSFPAISDGAVRVEAISSTKRKEDGSGYAVWTRVPVAFGDDPGRIAFDFAAGSALTLSGEVSLQLTGTVYNETGSETRKLQAGGETAATVAIIEDVASYEIQVELKGSAEQVIEEVSVFSSAASVVIGKVVSIVAVIASLAH